ncbi:MAG: ATP-binding protein [Syntrophothermaceae bacterium]|jgi:DNA polymerase-3 subunit delta'
MNRFSDIIGQTRVIKFLQEVLQSGEPSHAYLFTGPSGVGKTRAAVYFARELLMGEEARGRVMLAKGYHPDLFIAQRERSRVSIEEIRRLEQWLAYQPYLSSRRVAIIPQAHLLSLDAANALLKTLEEPPSYAVIILVSDEREILPTIASRCQEIRFSSLPVGQLEKALVEEGESSERAYTAALLGRGSIGRARVLAAHPDIDGIWEQVRSFLVGVKERGELQLLEKAEELEKTEEGRWLFFGALEILLRDILVYLKSGDEELLMVRENAGLAERFRGQDAELSRVLLDFTLLQKKFRTNVNPLLININLLFKLRQVV